MFFRLRNKVPKTLALIDVEIISHQGKVRRFNEDSVKWFDINQTKQSKGYLGIVADGMGGHLKGKYASKKCIELLAEKYKSYAGKNSDQAIYSAILYANAILWDQHKNMEAKRRPGTTCTAVAITQQSVSIAHIGDSRCYLYSRDGVQQLTEDHTKVFELYKKGQITYDQISSHPYSHFLTQAIGVSKTVKPFTLTIKDFNWNDDSLLLCTDGFSNSIRHEQLSKTLDHRLELSQIRKLLVNAIEPRPQSDNYSFMLIGKRKNLSVEKLTKKFNLNTL